METPEKEQIWGSNEFSLEFVDLVSKGHPSDTVQETIHLVVWVVR